MRFKSDRRSLVMFTLMILEWVRFLNELEVQGMSEHAWSIGQRLILRGPLGNR